ncbi:MAG: 30S ribosomal protein S17 [Gammaproteobacteria bacterium]|nr:30S ribosomal protein S17 [Gammaproteobacteria bacterium]
MTEKTEAQGRLVVGRVVSNKMDKTITVLVERQVRHPLYGKLLRRSTKLKAHDEQNQCNEGDLVSIQECRPLAKSKNWKLVQVLEKAQGPVAAAQV